MEQSQIRKSKKFVLLITDSRGAWLQSEFKKFQTCDMRFNVIYRKGAGLRTLWEVAEWSLFTRPIDMLLILGVSNTGPRLT